MVCNRNHDMDKNKLLEVERLKKTPEEIIFGSAQELKKINLQALRVWLLFEITMQSHVAAV